MTIKERIVEFLADKKIGAKVSEIQAGLPDLKPTCIWGTIASDKGKTFQKMVRGIYALKTIESTPINAPISEVVA